MSEVDTVTAWLDRLKADDSDAAVDLWHRYVGELIRLARSKLGRSPRRAADEEDVVVSAFDAFFRGVEDGRFSRLNDRDDLWQVLVMLTERKAINQIRRERAAKRGDGRLRGESALAGAHGSSYPNGLGQVAANEPTPEFAAQFREQFGQLLNCLDDDLLRQIAVGKLEGYTNTELAERLNLSLRAVERKLSIIRRRWERESSR
ncbi:MAG: ECF-type sigma factor [Planctomycetota bacterium]|nr:ECF-type sigma factor [Planctomycetota bacterium]